MKTMSETRTGSWSRWTPALLGAAMFLFLVIRLPLMYRQPGGTDEDCYAVPGLTILESGIPRLPHVPSRNPDSVFYHADEILVAEPPLFFYCQAALYSFLPKVYGTARLTSAIAGLIAILLVYDLGRLLFADERTGIWAAVLYSLSRPFFFPATFARPDMLCAMFGLAALSAAIRWQRSGGRRRLAVVGVLIGLGGLTHALALVYAIQIAGLVLYCSRGRSRLTNLAGVTSIAILTFTMCLPLVVMHPDISRIQIVNQYIHPAVYASGADQGLLLRLVWPWQALVHHGELMWARYGPIQFVLASAGWLIAAAIAWKERRSGMLAAVVLAASSVYLLSTFAGVHPAEGYWCYPSAWLFLCLGRVVSQGQRTVMSGRLRGWRPDWTVTILLLALMVPGFGLRTWLSHVRHWNNRNYNAPAFASDLISRLPESAQYVVDTEFTLDFYVAGRKTLWAQTVPFYFRADRHAYDYLIISRHGLATDIALPMNAEFMHAYGDQDDIFACYAEVYRSRKAIDLR